MSTSALALIGFASWSILLAFTIITLRSALGLTGKHDSFYFRPDGSDVSPFHMRLCRAHANCFENLPIFASLILVAMATGNGEVTDSLALWVLAARLAQSITHLISTSNAAITLRVTFFAIQLGIEAWWAIQLAQIALGG